MHAEELKKKMDQTKDMVLNRVLVIVMSVMILGITVSMLRISTTGFKINYAIQIFLGLIVIWMYLYRNKLKTIIKGAFFVGALYTLAISGLMTFGLYGTGFSYFIPAMAIGFVYFSKRTGWILTTFTVITIIVFGILFSQDILTFVPAKQEYLSTITAWLNMLITVCLIGVVITMFWNNLFSLLTNTFSHISYQQEDMRKMNEELIVAKNKAEESDRLKSAFLANMSHEIRTPLNIIIGFSGMVAETEKLEDRMELNQTVRENCDSMLKLVNDIVDFAKIESKTISFNNRDFSLMEIIKEIERQFQHVIPENVELIVQKPVDDVQMHSDSDRILQILFNIIQNATKFTQKGTIDVSYTINENKVNFKIADTGIGISNEELNKIFERFYKVDTFSQGAGLGLTISKWMVKLLGGEIWVESEVGKGSTFEFVLPVKSPVKPKFKSVVFNN